MLEAAGYFSVVTDRPRKVGETARARVYRLGEEPPDDLSATTTASERIEMVALLTRRAWELSGRPLVTIPRHEWPVSVIRPHD